MLTSQSGKTALCLCLLFVLAYSDKECDKTKCKGPLRFYEELKCKPVYENPGDCCAVRYNCSHLSTREPTLHCYANGHEYDFGETFRDEDNDNPCEVGCTCSRSLFTPFTGTFQCSLLDVLLPSLPKESCFHRYIRGTCHSAEVICPNEGEERAKCQVDGNTYLDGQDFYPKSRQDLSCECRPGFKGEFVEPFCWRSSCKLEKNNYYKIHTNCAPIYYNGTLLQTTCPYSYKCHYNLDEIIPASNKSSATEEVPDNLKCKYGNLLLNIGDKVKTTSSDDYDDVSCECEVPPTLTCRGNSELSKIFSIE